MFTNVLNIVYFDCFTVLLVEYILIVDFLNIIVHWFYIHVQCP